MARNLYLIAKTVWLESLRRKDLYVVLIFASFFTIWVAAERIIGIDSAATANFLMSFGLSMSYALAAILAAVVASRQLPAEFEARTLYPLLARPVARGEVYLGKWLGVASISWAVLLILILITYLPTPKSEEQRFVALGQMVLLQGAAVAMLSAFAMTLSLFAPTAVAVLASLATFFLGSAAVNYLTLTLESGAGGIGRLAGRLLAVIPDFSSFDHVQRFVDAQPALPWAGTVAILGYGGGVAAALYVLAAWAFGRRQL